MAPALTAQETTDRARALLESGSAAALPELLKLIETLSVDVCEVTISDLAELIEKDAVVLAKIVSVANKLAHNPRIAPIATLSQAIHQLGYNRIRTIAVSMMLLDNATGANPAEQREAAALALSAGLIAQGAAEFAGTHDPEFVFACATLRHFGRILMAAVSPTHCLEAIGLAPAERAEDGFRERFGLSTLELSRRLLAPARLPAEVMGALRDCEPEALGGVATTYDVRLLGLADFGGRLALLALGRHETTDGFVRSVTRLARRFEGLVPVASDIARPALVRANERLNGFARYSGTTRLPAACMNRLRNRLELLAPGASLEMEKCDAVRIGLPGASNEFDDAEENVTEPVRLSSSEPDESFPTAVRNWDDTLLRSTELAAESFPKSLEARAAEALAALRDLIAAKECWFFSVAPGATALSLTAGVGEVWPRLQSRATVRTEERSVFGVCLARREVVLVHETADMTLRSYLPDWWLEARGVPRAFALIPMLDGARLPVLVLVGWPEPRRVNLSLQQVQLARHLLNPALERDIKAA